MNGDPTEAVREDLTLDEVIGGYLLDLDAGRAPTREQLLAQYPHHAPALKDFLNNYHGRPVPTGSVNSGGPSDTQGRIGRIELKEVVGSGAFGTVFRGWDHALKRSVAVKVLRNDPMISSDARGRFRRDGEVHAQFAHPGIVKLLDIGHCEIGPYLVTEFIPGGTLNVLIREKDGKPRNDLPTPDDAARLVAKVADALEYVHSKGCIHRDVKPANILMRNGVEPLLTDFGNAFLGEEHTRLTDTGRQLGTPAYMSPEQARGQSHQVTHQSDLYSLGVVLYELLTGKRPFEGRVEALLRQIEKDEPQPPRAIDPKVPRDLETICLRCLRKDPKKRFPTAADLAADLRQYLARKPIRSRPVGPVERLVSWSRRNRGLAASFGIGAVLLVVVAIVSTAWAIDSASQTAKTERALEDSKQVRAETELDRGLAEAERGDVGLGMLWMARSLESLPPGRSELEWTIRVNLNAWRRQLPTLTDCLGPPRGKVLAFAPDGRSAWFVAPDKRTVRCWDLTIGQIVGPELPHAATVESITLSPDGTRIACGGLGIGAQIWEARTGKLLSSLGKVASVWGMTFSPDGGRLLLASGEKTKDQLEVVLKEWDGKVLRPLEMVLGRPGPIAMAAESNGQTLLTAGMGDKELCRWSFGKGRISDRFPRHPVSVKVVAISPDGKQVLTGSDDRLARLWDIESGQLLVVLPHRGPVTAVSFSNDGATLQTAAEQDAIRTWVRPKGDESAQRLLLPARVRALAVSPDGGVVITGTDDYRARVWTTTAGKLEQVGDPLPHASPIQAIVFSPDGRQFATSTHQDSGAQLWDVASRSKGLHLAHPDPVHTICYSPDGRLTATAAFDRDVWVWDTQTGQRVWEKPFAHARTVWAVAFSPDGRMLITGGDDCSVHRWDVSTGAQIGAPFSHDGSIRAVAFHPIDTQKLLTTGEDGVAKIWNVESGLLLDQWIYGNLIKLARFSSDGEAVLTGGRDGALRVWEVASGREIDRTLRHYGEIRALAVSKSGRWAVTASDDGTARLWATRTGRQIGQSVRHDPVALCAVIDPGDRWLVTAGMDKTVHFLKAPIEQTGSADQVQHWVQGLTGAQLDARGDIVALDPTTWRQRQPTSRTPGSLSTDGLPK